MEQCLTQNITICSDADFQYFRFIFNSVAHFCLIVFVGWLDPFSDCLSLLQQTLGLAWCIQSSRGGRTKTIFKSTGLQKKFFRSWTRVGFKCFLRIVYVLITRLYFRNYWHWHWISIFLEASQNRTLILNSEAEHAIAQAPTVHKLLI